MKIKRTVEEMAFLAPRRVGANVERDPLAYASDPRYIQALEIPRALALLESAKSLDDIAPAMDILRKVAERELRVANWIESESKFSFKEAGSAY